MTRKQMSLAIPSPADPRPRHPASRATDPDTSHDAEAKINASGKRDTQSSRVLLAACIRPGRTSAELGREVGRYIAARRLPELERYGYVVRGEQRKCRESGNMATTWTPTELGMAWFKNRMGE